MQQLELFDLWNKEYPEKITYNSFLDFEIYLNNLLNARHYLLLNDQEQITGWAFDFDRQSETWFVIIVRNNEHKKGLGTDLLNFLKSKNTSLNGWVIDHNTDRKKDGDFYPSPLEFYLKNGFQIQKGIRLELETLSAVKIIWTKKD